MITILIAAHVVAALLAIGPITVAASLFPRAARGLAADPTDARRLAAGTLLARVTRTYAIVGIAIPILGLAIAIIAGKLDQLWLLIAIALTVVAAVLLTAVILPSQRRTLQLAATGTTDPLLPIAARLAMVTGLFDLTWVIIAVLMVLHPGAPRNGA
jgi:hypothetical protein